MEDRFYAGPKNEFEPSPIVLKRVIRELSNNQEGRTKLSQSANVHYNVLLKHDTVKLVADYHVS